MNYLINFAHGTYLGAQKQNSKTGIESGCFDAVIQYKYKDIEESFEVENSEILNGGNSKGAGFWLWKPYFLLKTLKSVNEGDVIFYSDSGASFVRDVKPLINEVKNSPQGLACFHLGGDHKEGLWTQKTTLRGMEMDTEEIRNSTQIMASFVVAKKCASAISIIEDWLSFCKKPELIRDNKNLGKNYPGFRSHRHDQSIWSLICKKHKVKVLPDPTHWGLHYNGDRKDFFIFHHRQDPPPKETPLDLINIANNFNKINLKNHPALGTWNYHNVFYRDVSEDGSVVLRKNDDIIWTKNCISKTKDSFLLEDDLFHQFVDGSLNIEGKYKGARVQ